MIEAEIEPSYATALGKCFEGDALDVLRKLADNSVALVLTSPPFALLMTRCRTNAHAAPIPAPINTIGRIAAMIPRPRAFERFTRYDRSRASSLFSYLKSWISGSGIRLS